LPDGVTVTREGDVHEQAPGEAQQKAGPNVTGSESEHGRERVA
jgi:hypothetical protein